MSIPFFNQDVLSFFKSKTNWAALISLVIGLFMLSQEEMNISVLLITQSLAALGLRDALAKRV